MIHLLRRLRGAPGPRNARLRRGATFPRAVPWTRRALRALALARVAAQRQGRPHVDTEHILLGLLGEPDGLGARILADLGAHPARVRRWLFAGRVPPGQRPQGGTRLTPGAAQVLLLAEGEARQLGHRFLGTEHLLLGLLAEETGAVAGILRQSGVTLPRARAAVLAAVGGAG